MKVLMIDPAEGWKYGFPRPLPKEFLQHEFISHGTWESVDQWLIEQGYPKEMLKYPMRFFETEIEDDS